MALALTLSGSYQESLEYYATAISIYGKIQMTCHLQMALADFLMSYFMAKVGNKDFLFSDTHDDLRRV